MEREADVLVHCVELRPLEQKSSPNVGIRYIAVFAANKNFRLYKKESITYPGSVLDLLPVVRLPLRFVSKSMVSCR